MRFSVKSFVVLAIGAGLITAHQTGLAQATQDLILSIPAFDYPASVLSSAEQQQAYAKSLAGLGDGTIPLIKDPKMVETVRKFVNQQSAPAVDFVKQHYPVEIVPDRIAGIEVLRVKPRGGVAKTNRKRIILNLHGGAFMVGWPAISLLDAVPVAALSGIEVITINYRMYPEARHPAALEDLTAVYRDVLKDHAPAQIGIFGGSAGGVTTLQAIPWFKQKGLPMPGAIGALAAGFQTGVGDSALWNFKGGFSKPGTNLVEVGGYFGDAARINWLPETSPEALALYPPTLWMAGTRAPELSGAVTGHAKMLAKGVTSQLYVIEGGWHSSYSTAPQTPESQEAMRYVAGWFETNLKR